MEQTKYNSQLVFVIACIVMLVFGILMIALGAIIPQMVIKFEANELASGTLFSILSIGILIGSVSFGPIADTYGYKSVLGICLLIVAIGLEGIAHAQSWRWLEVSSFFIGIGGGAINGGSVALVSTISGHNKSARLSLQGAFYGVGALLFPLLITSLESFVSAEEILAFLGYMAGVLVLAFFFIRFPQPQTQGGFPVKEALKLIRNPTILWLAFILFFQSGMESLASNWTTTYMQSGLNIPARIALITLTVHVAALTIMRLALRFILERITTYTMLRINLLLILIGIILLISGNSTVITVTALVFLGLGYAGTFPIIMGRVGELWPKLAGTAFSITLIIAIMGNTLTNYLMGLVSFHWGATMMPYGTAFLFCFLSVMILSGERRFR